MERLFFPTRHTRAKQQYAGAIVFNPREPGRHENVTIMDYTSLYPTSIMAFNISPETFIVSEKSCKKMGINIEDVIQKLKDDGIGYIRYWNSFNTWYTRIIWRTISIL